MSLASGMNLAGGAPREACGMRFAEFDAAAREAGLPSAGLASAIYRNLFRSGTLDTSELAAGSRAAWAERFVPGFLECAGTDEEYDGDAVTKKALFRCPDGSLIESVLIPMASADGVAAKHTLCVSSQVGCRMGCAFCSTARLGLARSLEAWEIVSQALTARLVLGWDFGNIVFMGMGESLDNFDKLAAAIGVFADPRAFGMAAERMTVCTAGLPEGIHALRALGLKRLGLSVSLNSGVEATRRRLMPGAAARADLDELAAVLAEYPMRGNFALGVNVCLLPGINDSDAEVEAIAHFCARVGRCLVNVIPYNPGLVRLTRAPRADETDDFVARLRAQGLQVRVRAGKGAGMQGACGQLVAENRNTPQ